MRISVSEAKGQLTDLIRKSQIGEDVILTRRGRPVVRLVPVRQAPDRASRRTLLEALRVRGGAKAKPGPSAARSHDFLYGDDGLPK